MLAPCHMQIPFVVLMSSVCVFLCFCVCVHVCVSVWNPPICPCLCRCVAKNKTFYLTVFPWCHSQVAKVVKCAVGLEFICVHLIYFYPCFFFVRSGLRTCCLRWFGHVFQQHVCLFSEAVRLHWFSAVVVEQSDPNYLESLPMNTDTFKGKL